MWGWAWDNEGRILSESSVSGHQQIDRRPGGALKPYQALFMLLGNVSPAPGATLIPESELCWSGLVRPWVHSSPFFASAGCGGQGW